MTEIITKTERVPLDKLLPYPGNSRIGNVELVRESLRRNGQYRAIVVQEGTNYILAGNHTAMAARAEGWDDILVSWVQVDEDGARRINIVDNKANDEATYDYGKLDDILEQLNGDYTGTGFDAAGHRDLVDLIDGGMGWGAKKREYVPPLPGSSDIEAGDTFELGEHLLVCGDCTSDDTWSLVGGRQFDMVITDPPYGIAYDGITEHGELRRKDAATAVVPNDTLSGQQLYDFLFAAFARIDACLKPGGVFYIFAPGGQDLLPFMAALQAQDGLTHRQTLMWVKDRMVFGRQDYHYRHEAILYGWKKGAAHYRIDDRTRSTVIEHPNQRISKDHPTMKPVALVEKLVEFNSKPGDWICDPFAGSGSTMVAAAAKKRRCVSIELDPRYCEGIIERYRQLAGEES